jgi:hypothetical protein
MNADVLSIEMNAMERWRIGDPMGWVEGFSRMQEGYDKLKGKVHFNVMDFIDPQVSAMDNLAFLTYRFMSSHLTHDGSIVSQTPWNCTEVYLKMNGKWQIIHNHWSFIKGVRSM